MVLATKDASLLAAGRDEWLDVLRGVEIMGCQIRPNATACHMLSFGVSPKILLSLPCHLIGVHQGVTNRLACDGMIMRDHKERINGSLRMIWKAGPRLPGLLKWCREHGHLEG